VGARCVFTNRTNRDNTESDDSAGSAACAVWVVRDVPDVLTIGGRVIAATHISTVGNPAPVWHGFRLGAVRDGLPYFSVPGAATCQVLVTAPSHRTRAVWTIAYGHRIRERRLALKLTQSALADLCDLHRTFIGSVERGERNLSLLNLRRIARHLRLPPAALLDASGEATVPDRPSRKTPGGREPSKRS